MSRGWRLIEFDIVAPPPADDIVALSFGVSFEAIEIAAPLLDRDEARPVAPGASAVQDGCVDGGIACGIFGAVLIAGVNSCRTAGPRPMTVSASTSREARERKTGSGSAPDAKLNSK
jgi:hypothetical protein